MHETVVLGASLRVLGRFPSITALPISTFYGLLCVAAKAGVISCHILPIIHLPHHHHVTHSTLAEWRSTIGAIDNGRSKHVRPGLCRAHHFAKHTFWSQTSHHIHLRSPSTRIKHCQRAQALRIHLHHFLTLSTLKNANLLAASKAPMLRCGKFVPMQTSNSSFT